MCVLNSVVAQVVLPFQSRYFQRNGESTYILNEQVECRTRMWCKGEDAGCVFECFNDCRRLFL